MIKSKTRFASLSVLTLLAGCGGAPKPVAPGTNWQPVHAYTAQIEKKPLVIPHFYRALPSDMTLRGLLDRWAKEANASLDYVSNYDFSLVVHVKTIQGKHLGEAIKELRAIYGSHGVEIIWNRSTSTIIVRDSLTAHPAKRHTAISKP